MCIRMALSQITIFSLPDEVVTLILASAELSCHDLLKFGETCNKFNILLKTNQSLWKLKSKTSLPQDVYEVIKDNCSGNWLSELKRYCSLKNRLLSEVLQMSQKFYWRKADLFPGDVKNFFELAAARDINYFCSICILSDIFKKSRSAVYTCPRAVSSPYTLTTMHYSKVVLRYLIHTFLIVKWNYMHKLNKLQPEKIVRFFLQWIDTTKIHSEDASDDKIDELVFEVEKLLEEKHPLKSVEPSVRQEWAQNMLIDNMWNEQDSIQVLKAIQTVIYQQKNMSVTSEATIENLDIINVMKSKYANTILVCATFSAVARHCGVRCDVVAFPDHLFLEWKESFTRPSSTYHINHLNGEMEKKRRCPFANTNRLSEYKYCADSLLHYLYTCFTKCMGTVRDWSIQNAFYLMDFLQYSNDNSNPYRNYIDYLKGVHVGLPALKIPLDIKCVRSFYYDTILALVKLNKYWDRSCKPFQPKKHNGRVKFAVGMVCYHMKYDYVCIVRDWDLSCAASASWQERMAVSGLEQGADQPFYTVIAADFSKRYVAQENLRVKPNPTRLYTLEDVIAREFSHFDSYSYVPNSQKESEYPEDGAVRDLYRNRYELFPKPVRQVGGPGAIGGD